MLKQLITKSSRCAFLWKYNTAAVNCHRQLFGAPTLFAAKSDFDMEHLQNNPYFAKYAEKLKTAQDSAPEVFKQKVDELLASKKVAKATVEEESVIEESTETASEKKPESLESILKVDLIKQKSPDEIVEIWKAYHSKKDCVFAVLSTAEYEEIHRKSKDFPVFVYPLPRGDGYEFFVQRWSENICHFTPLISYQAHKENAVTCLSLIHYTEFMADKGIVLMRGEPLSNILSVHESQLLALQVKMYYGINSGLKFNYVRTFNNTPSSFSHSDLVREFDYYKRDLKEKIKRQDAQ